MNMRSVERVYCVLCNFVRLSYFVGSDVRGRRQDLVRYARCWRTPPR
jgi:hypothetical protein